MKKNANKGGFGRSSQPPLPNSRTPVKSDPEFSFPPALMAFEPMKYLWFALINEMRGVM